MAAPWMRTYLLVEAVFQVQLWRLRLHGLQLDGHVLVVVQVLAQPQLAKVAAADLLAHAEVGAHLHGVEKVMEKSNEGKICQSLLAVLSAIWGGF